MVADISLTTSYSYWFIPLCLLLGLAFSFISYYKNSKLSDVDRWKVIVMMALRSLSIALITFLLLDPVINSNFRSIEKPTIIIAQDKSSSILLNNDSTTLIENNRKIVEFTEMLANSYEVKKYSFGTQVSEGFKDLYDEKETDYSALLGEIEERHINRNVGALIIVSDGIYNKGANPLYSNHNFNFPLYTVAVGDTSRKKDLIITKAVHNKIAYLGNSFPIKAEITAHESNGETINVSIYKNDIKLASRQTKVNGNNFYTTIDFILEASNPGLQRYDIRISPLDDESNTSNNSRTVYIEVLDGRQNILILSNGPHPDIGTFVSCLSVFDNYKVEEFLLRDFTGNVNKYDLIILNQLPAQGQSATLVNEINKSNVSCLFILGGQSSITHFNELNTGLRISGNIRKYNEVLPVYSQDFALFRFNEKMIGQLSGFPPLISPFGEYQSTTGLNNLFTQKIGIVETGNPLITFTKRENKKIGIICGEGIWRWKLLNYQKTRNHEDFNEFIGKIVQYLSVKEDKSQFRISSKNTFHENEAITFDAELYNDAYELINEPEIEMIISDSSGKKFTYVFNRTTNAYTLNAGHLPNGNYSYEARVKAAGKTAAKSGVFTVIPILIESINTIADHQLLYQLSDKYNGEMVNIGELNKLQQLIAENETIRPVSYTEEKPLEIIHMKWIFFLILALLSLEWFMRKRNGAY